MSAISENPEGYLGPAPGRPGPQGPWFEKACPRAAGVDTSPPGAAPRLGFRVLGNSVALPQD